MRPRRHPRPDGHRRAARVRRGRHEDRGLPRGGREGVRGGISRSASRRTPATPRGSPWRSVPGPRSRKAPWRRRWRLWWGRSTRSPRRTPRSRWAACVPTRLRGRGWRFLSRRAGSRFREARLLSFGPDRFRVFLSVSKGFYVRSLPRDLGVRLGVPLTVSELRRTRVGPFRASQAVTLDALRERARGVGASSLLIPIVDALGRFPRWEVPADAISQVRNGRLSGPWLVERAAASARGSRAAGDVATRAAGDRRAGSGGTLENRSGHLIYIRDRIWYKLIPQ